MSIGPLSFLAKALDPLIVYSQLTENVIPDQLWTVVQIGLGGYVAGRSLEKTASSVVRVLKSKDEV